MPKTPEPIESASLKLSLQSASHVVGLHDERLIFPAIDFAKKAKPPTKNLNTDPKGPAIVQITVELIGVAEARAEYFGHADVERLSLFLTPEPFSDWLKHLEGLRVKAMLVGAEVKQGEIVKLTLHDQPVVNQLGSGTRELRGDPPSRTGTH